MDGGVMDKSLEMLLEEMRADIGETKGDVKLLLADKHKAEGKRTLINVVVSSCWAVVATLITNYFGAHK
jgi:hypothetical protein